MSYCTFLTDNDRSYVYCWPDFNGTYYTWTRDGVLFEDATRADCKARLLALRAAGHYIPQSAIKRLDAEMDAVGRRASWEAMVGRG